MSCLFCKILKKEVPSTCVYENEFVYAFKDINPVAPTHVLFISKKHSSNVNEMVSSDLEGLKEVFKAISDFSKKNGLDESGFRVVNNCGEGGGQTVFHTHFHLLGGKKLHWP